MALAHYGLGWTLGNLSHYEEAIGAYREAVRLDPDYGPAQEGLRWAETKAKEQVVSERAEPTILREASSISGTAQTQAQEERFEGRTLSEWQGDLQDLSPNVRLKAVAVLSRFGSRGVPILVKVLKNDRDYTVRVVAAASLGEIGPAAKNAVPALVQALSEKDREMRKHAATALYMIGPAAVPGLVEALRDNNQEVGVWAATALGWIGPAAVPALERAIKDRDPRVRVLAVAALGKAAGEDAVTALVAALTDKNWEVRSGAARILGLIGPAAKDAVPALKQALRDNKREVREEAAMAIRAIEKR